MASRRTPDPSRTSKPAVTKPPKAPTAETKKPVDVKAASAGAAATPADVAPTGASATAPARPKRTTAPKAPPATAAPQRAHVSDETRRAMIAESAYLRAERRGFAPGGEAEDWMAAEKEVDALLNANPGTGRQ